MALSPGTRVGPYQIVSPIGAGGMGEVYRARDTKLDRDVALKILPESFASDRDRLRRFEREAKTLASLNHPQIAQIFGIEEIGGTQGPSASRGIVMELVDGEDLAERIARGPIPIEDAIAIARQIAEALEAAHEAGVIHRDLKPANIKVRADGTVKVLDFGLAKAAGPPTSQVGARHGAPIDSPTFTSPAMTQAGLILGTAAYMSPEQAKGKPVDKRADIWAFGCVLYEMLTGRRVFEGEDVTDTLTAIMRDAPKWEALPSSTPAGVRRLIARCLERDAKRRLRDIGDAHADLDDTSPASSGAVSSRASRARTYIIAIGLLIAGVAAGIATERLALKVPGAPGSARATVTHITAPSDVVSAFHDGFALSPDGNTLAFAARDSAGQQQIWVRRIDSTEARPLPGTDGGAYPFWSPEGMQIAFFATPNLLRRVSISGGAVQTIAKAEGSFPTGTWNETDDILFGLVQGPRSVIYKVKASGGNPEPLVTENNPIRPQWLPGGREFLYSMFKGRRGVYIRAIDSGLPTLITELEGVGDTSWNFVYSPLGYLFVNQRDALTARRFDPQTRTLGSPVAIAGVSGTPNAWMTVSAGGDSMVAIVRETHDDSSGNPGDPFARLRWATRSGELIGELGERARYWTVRLAPDGRRATANFGDSSLWLLEGSSRRIPLTPRDGPLAFGAVWSPDGTELVFTQEVSDGIAVMRKRLDGAGQAVVLSSLRGFVSDWSPNGSSLLATVDASHESRGDDVVLYDLATNAARAWLATAANEGNARFSPDGQWIAYSSNASGRYDVFVSRLQPNATPESVSSAGGSHPIWRRDGRELFYLGPNDEMMAVAVSRTSDALAFGTPTRLFRLPLNDIARLFPPFDIAADGQRFLLNVPEPPSPLMYIKGIDQFIRQQQR